MKRIFQTGKAATALLLTAGGCMLGYFLGSMLPSPAYIADLQRIPLLMNTPEDVSLLVKRHLPDDAYKAFEVAANSSSNISIRKEEKCGCSLIYLERAVSRLPLPDRELTIYFELKDGGLKYGGASVVKWFL